MIRKNQNSIPTTVDFALLKEDVEIRIIKMLADFGEVVRRSAESQKPSILCRYLLDLCQEMNTFYNSCHVLKEKEKLKKARIYMCACVRQVTENGLWLLGIKAPKEM